MPKRAFRIYLFNVVKQYITMPGVLEGRRLTGECTFPKKLDHPYWRRVLAQSIDFVDHSTLK